MQLWSIVVPAKQLTSAKTRLVPLTAGDTAGHHELVLALLADTVTAALACPAVGRVLVVTDDPRAVAVVVALGAQTTPDEPRGGLNAALAHGARVAGSGPVSALHSDLPALSPTELAAALTAAAGHRRSFVADAAGTGTTLLAVREGALAPRFGPGSAAAHAAGGAVPLDGDWPGLRQDVDTPADLQTARRMGVGPRTAGFLSATRWSSG